MATHLTKRKDKMIRKMLANDTPVADICKKLHVSTNAVYARKSGGNGGTQPHGLNGELKPIFDKIAFHKKELARIGDQLKEVAESIQRV